MKKKVFVSFDYENDRNYKYLLNALSANNQFDLNFEDMSSQEINSWNVSAVKAALNAKIRLAQYTLVIIGKYANAPHKDRLLIGYINWINFEVAKSKENNNKFIAVKIDRENESPEELYNLNAKWAMSFNVDAITRAINEA